MTALPEAVEKMIEEIGRNAWGEDRHSEMIGAREMAEHLCALVCENCGATQEKHLEPCHFGLLSKSRRLAEYITRAEFYRRHPK